MRPRTSALAGDSSDTFGHGFDVFIETLIAAIGGGRLPFEEMDVQAVAQQIAHHAYRRGEVPDVRPLYGRCDDKQRQQPIVPGILTQAPVEAGGHDPVRALLRVQPESSQCVALGSAH